MKSRLEEDLRIGDLEGLIMDKFQVDSFQPKFCDEKDVAVVSFLVSQRESAVKLSDYISRGPFNFLNVEASTSPDEGGSYVVLAELDRSREMFGAIDQLLRYIDRQVHIRDWYFKPYASDTHMPWNKENFEKSVPQNPQEFQSGKNGDSKNGKPPTESIRQKADTKKSEAQTQEKSAESINYSLLARIVEREISKSSRSYFVEFQKQFRKVSKDNRRLMHHFREIKTDHQHLIKQLDLHQRREKLALMREQQDVKRIRDLEDRLTYLLYAGPEKREIAVSDASTPAIAVEATDASAAGSDAEEIVETEISATHWVPDARQPDADASTSDQAMVEEAEIVQPESEDADMPTGAVPAVKSTQTGPQAAEKTGDSTGDGAEVLPPADGPASPSDNSPVSALFRQAMEASEQKNYPLAIERFAGVAELAPDEPRAFYNLAILHFRLADYEKAEQCAQAAIDLGAESARKILDRATAKKSRRKASSAEPEDIGADKDHNADRSRRRRTGSRLSLPEEPLSGFEQNTVEIDAPAFAVSTATRGELTQSGERTDYPPSAGNETPKKEPPRTFGGFGSDDTVVIDSDAIAAVKKDSETAAAVEPAGREELPAEALKPADSSDPEIVAEPFDIEDMPTASLDDFIQPKTGSQKVLADDSVVAEMPAEEQSAGEAPGEAPATADPEAEMTADAVGAPVEEPAPAEAAADSKVVEVQPDVAVVVAPDTVDDAQGPSAPDVRPEEDPPGQGKIPPVVDMDLFARGLAASKKKNYAEALQHFTRFVEQNPTQPRGYYNLAILHYRLKDFETARDMARKALDMGIGSAQKVYEKSQIRLAKERSIALDTDESAATDTIFEELDTAAFETIDPGSLEEIVAANAELPPEQPVEIPEVIPPLPEMEAATGQVETEPEIDVTETAEAGLQTGQETSAGAIPEFPVLTGEVAQEAGFTEDDAVADATEEDLPEIEAVPIAEPAAAEDRLAVALSPIETAAPPAATEEPLAEPAVESAPAPAAEPEATTPKGAEEKEHPVEIHPEEKKPAPPEPAPDKTSEDLFAQGMKAYADKNFDEAIELFKRFISLRPREPRGYYNMAIVHYRRKAYPEAKANAEKALQLGARAARKILQKIKRKEAKTTATATGPAAAGKKRSAKRPVAAKTQPAASTPKAPAKTAETKESGGAAAASISTPEPVEGADVDQNLGDISDYDTATFDIAEVLGHDPVVWDADDMEEEVDTSEIQPPLVGDETGDDVIVFESAAAADTASPRAAGPRGADGKKGDRAGGATQKAAVTGGGGEIPGGDLFSLGLAASEKKEYLRAIRYFKKFTDLSPQDPRGYYNLAVVSYRLKSYETAREHAKRALELGSKPAAKILTKLKSMQAAA